MNLYLIRHGETPYNRDGLGLGRADVPLTELGERQAAALGAALATRPIERIFSSPLGRAQTTARAVAGERKIAIEPRDELLELDVGETEGMQFAEMRKRFPEFLERWVGPHGIEAIMPGGESLRDVADRLVPFVAELKNLDTPSVAVVSHNFVTRLLLCLLLELDLARYQAFSIGLTSYCLLDIRKERVAVVTMNEGCHLDSLEPAAHSA